MDGGSGMGGSLGWWVLGLVIFITALVVVIGVRFRSGRQGNRPPVDQGATRRVEGRNTARKLLDDRYARGEIGTDEYRERVITLDQEN